MLLGSQVTYNDNDLLVGAVEEAHSYNANTFMIFSGGPHSKIRRPIDKINTQIAHENMKKYNIESFSCHASYLINLANVTRKEQNYITINLLEEELSRTEALGSNLLTVNPGSHVGIGETRGIRTIIKNLNTIISKDCNVKLSLETLPGSGTQMGYKFEHFADILSGVSNNNKLSITFNLAYLHDAGYNLSNDFDSVLNDFDKIIGLEYLDMIYLNDSKNEVGSRKGEITNIEKGEIGYDAIYKIVHHPQLINIPKIINTPLTQEGEDDKFHFLYQEEIAILKK